MTRAFATIALAVILASASHAQPVPVEGTDYRVFSYGKPSTLRAVSEAMATADVVVVGEYHDHAVGHLLELELLKALHSAKRNTVLSLEFFERDVQDVLDEYLADQITQAHFLLSSRPWPTYKMDYSPLVEYCKANKLKVVAANAPRRYVNLVSRKGRSALDSLSAASRANLGPIPYSMDLAPGYARMLDDLFGGGHAAAAPGVSTTKPERPVRNPPAQKAAQPPMAAMPSAANMKESQALWDATMADSVVRALDSNPGATVIQMNGAGHSDFRYGLVDRIDRARQGLRICVITIKPDESFPELPLGKYLGIGDFVLLTAPQPPPRPMAIEAKPRR